MPLAVVPVGSTGFPASSVDRQPPITSKFSSVNPNGSITEWQLLHVGLVRCWASLSRIVFGAAPGWVSSAVFTPGGGGGMGRPKILFRSHLPRSTGEVRSGYDVVTKMAPCANNPP